MRAQTPLEERYNSLSHGIGFIIFSISGVLLLSLNKSENPISYFALGIYSLSLIVLYFISTAYHFSKKPATKNYFRKLDHISIYLLIAGTYSPVTLLFLSNSRGALLFVIVWSIAFIGTILKIFFTGKFEIISLLLYLVMGWLIILDINALSNTVDTYGMSMLITGGCFYTAGIIFYVWDRLYFNHVIWHIFVLLGSLSHFLFIFHQVT